MVAGSICSRSEAERKLQRVLPRLAAAASAADGCPAGCWAAFHSDLMGDGWRKSAVVALSWAA